MKKLFALCNLYQKRFFVVAIIVGSFQLDADNQSRRNLNKNVAQQESLQLSQEAEKIKLNSVEAKSVDEKKDVMQFLLIALAVFDQAKKAAEESSLLVNFKNNIRRIANVLSSEDELQALTLFGDDCSNSISAPQQKKGLAVHAFAGAIGSGSSGSCSKEDASSRNSGIRVNSSGGGSAVEFKPRTVETKNMIPQVHKNSESRSQGKENSRDSNSSRDANKKSKEERKAEIQTQRSQCQKEQHVEENVESRNSSTEAEIVTLQDDKKLKDQGSGVSQSSDSISKPRVFVSKNIDLAPVIKDTKDIESGNKKQKSSASSATPDVLLKTRSLFVSEKIALSGLSSQTFKNKNDETLSTFKSQNDVNFDRNKSLSNATTVQPKVKTAQEQPESSFFGGLFSLFTGKPSAATVKQESYSTDTSKEECYVDDKESVEQNLPLATALYLTQDDNYGCEKKIQEPQPAVVHGEPQSIITPLAIAIHKAKSQAQRRARVLECQEAQAAVAVCVAGRDSSEFFSTIFYDFDCEEGASDDLDLPDNAMASEAIIFTAGGFGAGTVSSALLSAVPQAFVCVVLYTGGRYLVNLISDYKKTKNETPGERAVREAAERYASDFQYALNATLHIPTCGAVPESSVFYSSMCYGYGNDSYARVVTIVDIHHKQHIFVVPDDPRKSVFQVSDGSWDFYAHEIPSRYFVPQSTIDAVKAHNKAQAQAIHDAKVKALQDKADLFLACVEKDLKKVDEKKIGSKEHLLPIYGASGIFQAARSADGVILRNKAGDYFDIQGNCYVLSKDEKTWNVKVLAYGSTSIINVAQPKSAQNSSVEMQPFPPIIPGEMACGQIDSELKQPTALPGGNINDLPKPRTDTAHDPVPDFPLTVLPGGNVNDLPAPRTDTAHDPVPDFSQQLPGCGGLQTPEIKPEDYILQARDDKTWTDKDGIVWDKGDLSGQDVRFRKDNSEHLFDDRPGHVIDNPENREKFITLAKDPTKYLTESDWGNWWYAEILPDGTQLWVEVRGDKIWNCGINETPRECSKETGLSLPKAPGK